MAAQADVAAARVAISRLDRAIRAGIEGAPPHLNDRTGPMVQRWNSILGEFGAVSTSAQLTAFYRRNADLLDVLAVLGDVALAQWWNSLCLVVVQPGP